MAKRIFIYLLISALVFASSGCSTTEAAQLLGTSEQNPSVETKASASEDVPKNPSAVPPSGATISPNENLDESFTRIVVDGGNMSGYRQPMAVVDVGFGDREYLAYTNEYGQLIRVTASVIRLQDNVSELLLGNGRYYPDEAKVPGTERSDLDQGHVIADSLGGVSNAYNITPQDSVLNRHGDQAYMEKVIRDSGGCTDFEAVITYPDNKTQIPSHYSYTYTINSNVINDSFDNVNPDMVNQALKKVEPTALIPVPAASTGNHDISAIDANNNGQVSIKEAKAAGFKMPISRDHWLYQYMTDGDDDGFVGE